MASWKTSVQNSELGQLIIAFLLFASGTIKAKPNFRYWLPMGPVYSSRIGLNLQMLNSANISKA